MNKRILLTLLCFVLILLEGAYAQDARQWIARFKGTQTKGNDLGRAIVADDSGYIYVAGSSARKTTGVDFVVIKYNSDGALQWTAYYAGVGKGTDEAVAIAIDTSYNVYVTGPSLNSSGNYDYATVKFDRNGLQVWAVRYNGPGNGEDRPIAIAVNDSLNVYVTGYSAGTGTGYDFATVKYRADGTEAWVQRFTGPGHGSNGEDRPYAMALRGTTDLYVAGTSQDENLDYFIVKYSPATGDTVWTVRYNGADNGDDVARSMVVSSSYVIVTGSIQTATNGYDYMTIKYDATTHEILWSAQYNGTANGNDIANSVAVSSNKVFVTGKSMQIGSYYDMATAQYGLTTGNLGWVSTYTGPANDNDYASVVNGSPYVLGPSTGYGTKMDYTLIKYSSSSGSESTPLRYNGPANADDIPTALTTSDGSVIVTGYSSPDGKTYDILTIKYVDSKKLKYRTFIQDSLIRKGVGIKTATTIPNMGNVRDTVFARAFPKLKKGFPGAPGGMVLGNERPDSAAVYGWIRFNKGSNFIKFLPQTGTARGYDVYADKPFVGEKKDPKLAAFNDKIVGELMALKMNIGSSDAEVTPPLFGDLTYLGLDTIGGLPLANLSLRQIAGLTDNFLTYWKKYPTLEWDSLYNVIYKINRAFLGPMEFVSNAPLVMTGVYPVDSAVFLSADNLPVQVPLTFPAGSLDVTPEQYALYQNYPNPFNPSTTIRFQLSEDSRVTLKVFNMLGQEVASLMNNEDVEGGEHEVRFDAGNLASGVYFYKLIAQETDNSSVLFQQVRKMLILK